MNFIDEQDSFSQVRGTGVRVDPSMQEFEAQFNQEYGANIWEEKIQPSINRVFRDIFVMVSAVCHTDQIHPTKIALHPNSGWSLTQPNACPARGMYGVDIILRHATISGTQTIQPTLLEVCILIS